MVQNLGPTHLWKVPVFVTFHRPLCFVLTEDDGDMSLSTMVEEEEEDDDDEPNSTQEDLTSLLGSTNSDVFVSIPERYERPQVKCM